MVIILSLTGLIFIVSIYISNNSSTKANNNILIGITIPALELKNKEVLRIIDSYKKENIKFMIGSIIAFIPGLFMTYISFQFLYLFLWVVGLMYGSNKIIMKYNKELMNLKREKDWLMPSKHLITIDTEVSRLKDKMIISKMWFIPSIVISIIPIIIAFGKKNIWSNSILFISFTAIISTIVFIIVYKRYGEQRTEVFSEDSKVNLACNIIYKRTWTVGCVLAATIQSISMFLMFLLLMIDSTNEILFILIVILPATIVVLGMYYINDKVRKDKNRLIQNSKNNIYTDNDEYWKNDVYNNPNDPRKMIEKRIGYGLTYNLATKKGKIMTYGSYVLGVVIPVVIIFMFFIFDFSKFTLSIDSDLITISVPIYKTSFKINDIEDIKLVENIPKGFKSNGVGTERYRLGNYSINGYGSSKLYVYNENPPYIAIKLKNSYVFINSTSKEETEIDYQELIEVWGKKNVLGNALL